MGLLTQLQWRSVTMRFTRSPSDLEMLNDYAQTAGRHQMPAIAVGSACWALVKNDSPRSTAPAASLGFSCSKPFA